MQMSFNGSLSFAALTAFHATVIAVAAAARRGGSARHKLAHTAAAPTRDGDEEAVRGSVTLSPSASTRTSSPQTPALLSQTPAPQPAGAHAGRGGPQSCFQQNMLLLSLSKH